MKTIDKINSVLGVKPINEVFTKEDQKRLDKAAKTLFTKITKIREFYLKDIFDDLEDYARELYHDDLQKAAKDIATKLAEIQTILNR